MATPNARASSGIPAHDAPQGTRYEEFVSPTQGASPLPFATAPSGSLVSLQNAWVVEGALQPRWRLSNQTANGGPQDWIAWGIGALSPSDSARSGLHLGGMNWDAPDLNGGGGGLPAPGGYMISGSSTAFTVVSTFTGPMRLSWSETSQISANGTSTAPSLKTTSNWFGTTVYSAPRNLNLAVLSGNTGGRMFCFDGLKAAGLAPPLFIWLYSALTGAPSGAYDCTTFDNRVVVWNCSNIPQRVQWCVAGDPEDWTGLGSGSEDLVDMTGFGTRCFVAGDDLILGSTREIWRGRAIGLPYNFQFAPLERKIGIPWPRAALNTPFGIVWLGDGYMLYRLVGGTIQPFGAAWQQFLQRNLVAPEVAFLTYNAQLNHIRLWYTTSTTAYPNRSLTYDIGNNVWTHETWNLTMHGGMQAPSRIATYYGVNVAVDFPVSEMLISSAGKSWAPHSSTSAEAAASVTVDAWLAPNFRDDPRYRKNVKEVRLDYRVADVASSGSLQIGVSPNQGSTVSENKAITLAVSTSPTQSLLTFDTEASAYPMVRLRSTDTSDWRVSRVYVMGERQGR